MVNKDDHDNDCHRPGAGKFLAYILTRIVMHMHCSLPVSYTHLEYEFSVVISESDLHFNLKSKLFKSLVQIIKCCSH
jgi:hypothetical protein